jgi:hypothetical protein
VPTYYVEKLEYESNDPAAKRRKLEENREEKKKKIEAMKKPDMAEKLKEQTGFVFKTKTTTKPLFEKK